MSGSIAVGILVAAGAYLLFQRGIVRMVLGFIVLGHAANLLLVLSGGIGRRGAPLADVEGIPADPLPQAFALTAIVISFAVTAFFLALAYRSSDLTGNDDIEESPEDDDG